MPGASVLQDQPAVANSTRPKGTSLRRVVSISESTKPGIPGSAWSRPKFNMDNPLSTSSPSSCTYEDSSYNLINFSGQYLVIDNLEILGYCWNVTAPWSEVVTISTNDEMKNSYWHGWTMGTTATGCGSCDSDEYWAISSPWNIPQWSRIDHNVFDGSDSTYGNLFGSYGDATGGIFKGGGEIDHNVLNHCSNGVKYTDAYNFHDNLLENMYEPRPGDPRKYF